MQTLRPCVRRYFNTEAPRSKVFRKPRSPMKKDIPLVRVSKAMSYILRHGALREGLPMRSDGYVRVKDLLNHPLMQTVNFATLEAVVETDFKRRYHLKLDPGITDDGEASAWWICATQGHSMAEVTLDLEPIFSAEKLPIAIHGTTEEAWKAIAHVGIHRMSRNHIHLAKGLEGEGVISGIRVSSKILIYINVQKAMDAGIKFYMSKNGVVLTPGNNTGYLEPQFFHRVDRVGRQITQIPLDKDP